MMRRSRIKTGLSKEAARRELGSRRQPKLNPRKSFSRAYSGQIKPAQPTQKTKARAMGRYKKIWLLVLGAIVIVFGLFQLLGLGRSVKVVLETDNSQSQAVFYRSADQYGQFATEILSKTIASRSKLTLDQRGLKQQLTQAFPELDKVEVSLPLFGTTMELKLWPAQATVVLSPSEGTSVLVDSSGLAIGQASKLPKLKLPTVIDETGLRPNVGQKVLERNVLELCILISQQLATHQLSIDRMVLPKDDLSGLNLYVKDQSFYVKFDTRDNSTFAEQVGGYLALIKYLKQQKITPNSYVDVRLPGRAYYK